MTTTLFKISLAIFIASNLLDLGLRLNPKEAWLGLKNYFFVGHILVWGFVVGPTLAYGITYLLPLQAPYAMGLLLLSMTPGAPFLPMVMRKANVDLGYTAAFMVLVSVTTVLLMPILVPWMLTGLAIQSWTLAKPLVLVMLIPFLIGMSFQYFNAGFAIRIQPVVRKSTAVFAIVACSLCVLVYGEGLLGIDPGWAVASLIIFFFFITALPFWLGVGLPEDQRQVLSMGLATRNLGATAAPLLVVEQIDQRAIIMVGLGLPCMLFFAWLSMKWFGHPAVTKAM
jgi:bile acid:Na+ symporter, BASS family